MDQYLERYDPEVGFLPRAHEILQEEGVTLPDSEPSHEPTVINVSHLREAADLMIRTSIKSSTKPTR